MNYEQRAVIPTLPVSQAYFTTQSGLLLLKNKLLKITMLLIRVNNNHIL